jgi:hypothetical protein
MMESVLEEHWNSHVDQLPHYLCTACQAIFTQNVNELEICSCTSSYMACLFLILAFFSCVNIVHMKNHHSIKLCDKSQV